MSKNEFLNQLSILLSDVSPEEREEALAYYREYIEDAGFENEEAILEELGTPEAVAAEIKSGMLNKNNQDINYSSNTVKQPPAQRKNTNTVLLILAIIALILLSPVWLGLLSGVFGLLAGLFATIFFLILGFGIAGIVCFIVGIIVFIAGFPFMIQNPIAGVACLGAGLVVSALGILFLLFTGWLCIGVIPWVVRSISNLIHRFSNRRREANV